MPNNLTPNNENLIPITVLYFANLANLAKKDEEILHIKNG